jgi:hypothetical protein
MSDAKKISLFFLLLILSGCSMNRYYLTDRNRDKKFLVEKIRESTDNGQISGKPIIVLDGVPYRYEYELKKSRLPLSKTQIESIDILKDDVGKKIYGVYAEGGVMIVTSKNNHSKEIKPKEDEKILFLIDDKVISKSEVEKINPDDIETITVVKDDKEKIRQYTTEDYDGVIIIHLKNGK